MDQRYLVDKIIRKQNNGMEFVSDRNQEVNIMSIGTNSTTGKQNTTNICRCNS